VATDQPRPPVAVLSAVPDVTDVQVFGDRAHVRFADVAGERAATAITSALERSGIRSVSVRPIPASLEDVFIDLIAGTPHGGNQA
jgi:hypothetical protein